MPVFQGNPDASPDVRLAALEAAVAALDGLIEANKAAADQGLAAAGDSIESLDVTQQGRVNGEQQGREARDQLLADLIADEEAQRVNAVEILTGAVSVEVNARTAADTALGGRIDDEVTARTTAITGEATARTAADTALGGRIDDEVTARTAAITGETTARTAADTALGGRIDDEVTARTAAITGEANARAAAITGEATARAAADTALGGRIDDEVTARTAAITAEANVRAAAITGEATARTAADTALGGRIDDEVTARTAAITAEANVRAAAITGESTARTAADTALGGRIDDEVTARTAAITGEATARTAADTALGGRIDTEITARTSADALLAASATAAAPSVRDRAPKATDDTTKGYAVDDLWAMRDGRQYKALSVAAGAAVWSKTPQSNTQIPEDMIGDRVPGASLIFAAFKMRAAYTGYCFRVKRGSDNTTLDIGFVYNSDLKLYVADWAACDKFIDGTTAWYNIIYDQSGNGYDLTEVAGKQVFINSTISRSLNDINGLRTLCFWGGPTLSMKIADAHTVERTNCTVISAGLVESSGHGNAYCELGTDASYLNRLLLTTIVRDGRLQPIGNTNLVGTRVESGPHVLGAAFGAAATNYMCNDAVATSGVLSAKTLTGGFVGSANGGGYTYWGDYAAFMVYPTALPTATMQLLRRWLTRTLRIQPQCRDRMVIVGDSITVGADTPAQPWWRQALPSFDGDWKVFNNALEGDRVAAAIPGYSGFAGNLYAAGRRNVLVVAYGTNDLAQLNPANGDAANATTVYNDLVTLCGLARATGYKVVICTILPRNNAFTGGQTVTSFEASRLLLNAQIVANWATFADGLADYGSDPYIGQLANVTDATWMNGNLHPKARGHAIMSGYVVAAVNGLVWP